jgi:hypothetical protein
VSEIRRALRMGLLPEPVGKPCPERLGRVGHVWNHPEHHVDGTARVAGRIEWTPAELRRSPVPRPRLPAQVLARRANARKTDDQIQIPNPATPAHHVLGSSLGERDSACPIPPFLQVRVATEEELKLAIGGAAKPLQVSGVDLLERTRIALAHSDHDSCREACHPPERRQLNLLRAAMTRAGERCRDLIDQGHDYLYALSLAESDPRLRFIVPRSTMACAISRTRSRSLSSFSTG